MDGRSLLILILVIIVVAGVAIALIRDAIQKKDFRDQITGKKPERTLDDGDRISYDAPPRESSRIAIDRELLRTKSGQDLLGPK